MEATKFRRQVRFILRFGKALHAAGTPAHTLEGTMQEMCQLMHIKGTIISQPTGFFASFSDDKEEVTKIERVEPMGVNLGRLASIDLISREVIGNIISYEEGYQKLEDVLNAPEPFGKRIHLSYFLFSAAGFLVLFGGHWGDFLAAAVVGVLMGILYIFRPMGPAYQMFEAVAAVIASLATYLLAKFIPALNVGVIILSSLIIFMPGVYITLAIAEIATQNLVSGTARLVGGTMILLKLTFGVFIGSKIASWFHYPSLDVTFGNIPVWVAFITLPLTALMSLVGFRGNREDWKWVMIAGIIGYLSSKLGAHFLGAELGMFFGGACIGAMSNLFARLKNRPSSIFQFPGIILLVPGSVGYRSMNYLFERDVLGGLDTAFTMVALAMSLVVGLFLGNLIIKPRSSL